MAEAFETESRAGEEGSAGRRLVRVYVEALLKVAEELGQGDDVGKELRAIVTDIYAKNPDIEEALTSPVAKRIAMVTVLEQAFRGKISDLTFDFLMVLNSKDRLSLVRYAAAALRDLLDERAKRVRV